MFITYNAPKGDEKVVEYMGVELFDGHPADLSDTGLDEEQLAHLIAKAKNNPFFELSDEKPSKRGRETKADAAEPEGA